MPTKSADTPPPLKGRELIVGVCGGISAYKTAALVSRLVQSGAGVTVVMTEAARKFIGEETFAALTARRVFSSIWHAAGYDDPQHIRLTESANLFVIAPATANTIGKIANGLADDLLSTMVMSAACPVLLAPAMNDRMWNNPLVRRNVEMLQTHGYHFVGPDDGWQACRTVGAGRMAEPDAIFAHVSKMLAGSATQE